MRRRVGWIALSFGLVAAAAAGPLDPPAGPVAPTMKTLVEVEPRIPVGPATTPGDGGAVFRITQPGSYYLVGRVLGVSGKSGIIITASHVTLDLMGYEVVGVPGSNDGIRADEGVNITVRNGAVLGWEGMGVYIGATGARVSQISASSNGIFGVGVGGRGSVVQDCTATGNVRGIVGGDGSVVSRCAARGNTTGIVLGVGVVATECAASDNTQDGFSCNEGGVLRNCLSTNNGRNGFQINAGSSLVACTASNNQEHGITGQGRNSVLDCMAHGNRLHGITLTADCMIRGNFCTLNGDGGVGSGIHVAGGGSRVEANHCTDNDRGVEITAAGNLIIRNSVNGNSVFGYAIASGNLFGPNIFNAAGIQSSTNPHSNYEH